MQTTFLSRHVLQAPDCTAAVIRCRTLSATTAVHRHQAALQLWCLTTPHSACYN